MAGAGWRDFIAGEVLTAANVQDYLQDQAVMTFASSAARGSAIASPTEGMVSFLKDSNLIEVHDSSAWKPIIGTTGSVLSTNFVQMSAAQTFTGTNANLTDLTGLSITVTPKSTASKFIVVCEAFLSNSNAFNGRTSNRAVILRNSTSIASTSLGYTGSDNNGVLVPYSVAVYDAPATGSALTYKVQAGQTATGSSITSYVNRTEASATVIANSWLMVLEIAN